MPVTIQHRIAAVGLLALGSVMATPLPATAADRLSVAVVAPITVWNETGLLDADQLAILTAPTGALTRELEAILATPATIALDPMIPASIRVLGASAPQSAVQWLSRLGEARNEVFLLAYADADLSGYARADALDLAVPSGFEFATDPTAFGPAETPTPAPTPGDAPPPLPTTEEILAWTRQLARIAWPSEGSVVPADLPAYRAAGYDAVLLSSENASEAGSARAESAGTAVLIADRAASELMQSAGAAVDDATRRATTERLTAALEGLAAADPGRTVIVTLQRATSSLLGFTQTVAALSSREGIALTGLSTVLAAEPVGVSIVESAPTAALQTAPALVTALRDVEQFSSIVANPLALTAPRRLELLALTSIRSVAASDWPDRAAAFIVGSGEILGSVRIGDTGNILVTSSQTSLPVLVENGLDHAVTVRVRAVPIRPLLRIESPVEVTVEPGSSRTVLLDAQAITNGEVTVQVSLSDPVTGGAVGTPRHFAVTLQAQWETIGIVIGALVGVVFLAGIVRNILVRRRDAEPTGARRAETG